jgi:hypothetical protein
LSVFAHESAQFGVDASPGRKARAAVDCSSECPQEGDWLVSRGAIGGAGDAQRCEDLDQASPRGGRLVVDHIEAQASEEAGDGLPTAGKLVGGQRPTCHVSVRHAHDGFGVVVETVVVEEVLAGRIETVVVKETATSKLVTLGDRLEDGLVCDHR